jgi:hypothetical protein
MSNAEVIALIDEVLVLPISISTKNDLRSFRLQVQAGTIAEDDRNYVITLCQRFQQGKGEPSVLRERAGQEAEDRRAANGPATLLATLGILGFVIAAKNDAGEGMVLMPIIIALATHHQAYQ